MALLVLALIGACGRAPQSPTERAAPAGLVEAGLSFTDLHAGGFSSYYAVQQHTCTLYALDDLRGFPGAFVTLGPEACAAWFERVTQELEPHLDERCAIDALSHGGLLFSISRKNWLGRIEERTKPLAGCDSARWADAHRWLTEQARDGAGPAGP